MFLYQRVPNVGQLEVRSARGQVNQSLLGQVNQNSIIEIAKTIADIGAKSGNRRNTSSLGHEPNFSELSRSESSLASVPGGIKTLPILLIGVFNPHTGFWGLFLPQKDVIINIFQVGFALSKIVLWGQNRPQILNVRVFFYPV